MRIISVALSSAQNRYQSDIARYIRALLSPKALLIIIGAAEKDAARERVTKA